MARYIKELPMVDYRENTFPQIQQYLQSQKYEYLYRDGEQVFQKGKGVWVAPSFIKVSYRSNTVKLEAWIDAMGSEQGLDGVVGVAAKKPLKKAVEQVEQILTRPNGAYAPEEVAPAVCTQCGTELKEGIKFCTSCGAPVREALDPVTLSAVNDGFPVGTQVSKKEYYKKYAGESFYRNLKITAICGYVLSGLAMISALTMPLLLLDLAIYLGLTLGMHLGKSKGCAIGITAYSAFSVVYALILTGQLAGWGWLAVGIWGIVIFSNADKRYKKLVSGK